MKLEILKKEQIPLILPIVSSVNSKLDRETIEDRLTEMFSYENYICFGLFENSELLAVTSGWILTKIYSGKQLELDNFAVIESRRDEGIGEILNKRVKEWAKENKFISIELNTYVTNSKSHKFYFNQGYEIIGYHFQQILL